MQKGDGGTAKRRQDRSWQPRLGHGLMFSFLAGCARLCQAVWASWCTGFCWREWHFGAARWSPGPPGTSALDLFATGLPGRVGLPG